MMIICQFQFITFDIKKKKNKGKFSEKSLLTIFLQKIIKALFFYVGIIVISYHVLQTWFFLIMKFSFFFYSKVCDNLI